MKLPWRYGPVDCILSDYSEVILSNLKVCKIQQGNFSLLFAQGGYLAGLVHKKWWVVAVELSLRKSFPVCFHWKIITVDLQWDTCSCRSLQNLSLKPDQTCNFALVPITIRTIQLFILDMTVMCINGINMIIWYIYTRSYHIIYNIDDGKKWPSFQGLLQIHIHMGIHWRLHTPV